MLNYKKRPNVLLGQIVPFCLIFLWKGKALMENREKRERTRTMLKNALIALCDEKSYYDITIWDICNKAEA